jgi:hypothetical protein
MKMNLIRALTVAGLLAMSASAHAMVWWNLIGWAK